MLLLPIACLGAVTAYRMFGSCFLIFTSLRLVPFALGIRCDRCNKDAETMLEKRKKAIGRGSTGLFLVRLSGKIKNAIVISMYATNAYHHYNVSPCASVQQCNAALGATPRLS